MMFDFNIPIISWILIGLEFLFALVCLLWLLRPLRRVSRHQAFHPDPIPEETINEPLALNDTIDSYESEVAEEGEATEEVEITEEGETTEEIAENGLAEAVEVVEDSEIEIDNDSESNEEEESLIPKVSVIVDSIVDEETLEVFLQAVSTQTYPDYEVIVICDATAEATAILNERFAEKYPRVYVTFIPPGSHNVSRHKLALTIGIKAAKGDIIVTTVANAVIPSDDWISLITTPIIASRRIELSLGLSRFDYGDMPATSRGYREFVTTLTDIRWVAAADAHRPYRGDGYNLAFRKDLFFRNKGYAQTIFLHSGDDDLFIHQVATSENTAVVLESDSILTILWPGATSRVWKLRKSQYEFTSRWLPCGPFVKAGLTSTMQWLIPALGTAAALIALPSLIAVMAAVVIWITFISFEASFYAKAAPRIGSHKIFWRVPLFWLYKPIGNAFLRISQRDTRFKFYTWQRHR